MTHTKTKKPTRRLSINKTTLRHLQTGELEGVRGARQPTSTNPCMSLNSACQGCID